MHIQTKEKKWSMGSIDSTELAVALPQITLSTGETEHLAAASCVFHALWLVVY